MGICDSNGADLMVEYSLSTDLAWNDGGHTWTEVSDVVGMLDVTGGERAMGEYKAFGKTYVGLSKPGAQTVTLDVVFKNALNTFLEKLTDLFDGTEESPCIYLRWSYANGASGSLRRTALCGLLGNPITGGSGDSGNPVVKKLAFGTEEVKRDTVP